MPNESRKSKSYINPREMMGELFKSQIYDDLISTKSNELNSGNMVKTIHSPYDWKCVFLGSNGKEQNFTDLRDLQ